MKIAEQLQIAEDEPIESLLTRIGARLGVPLSDVMGRSQEPRIANARHVGYWALRLRGYSYPTIGRLMERDHSTVMAGLAKVMREIAETPGLEARLLEIIAPPPAEIATAAE